MFSKAKTRPHAGTRVHANTIKAAVLFGATAAALLAFAAVVITTKAAPTDRAIFCPMTIAECAFFAASAED